MSCDPNLCQLNKLAKLRRHASQVHFASNSFGPIHFVFEHFNPLGYHPSDLVLHLVHLLVRHLLKPSITSKTYSFCTNASAVTSSDP